MKDYQSGIYTPAAMAALAKNDFENFMTAATPGGIERQEAMGQAAFVGTKSSLPIQCPRQQLEALGFQFGEPIDDLFVSVTFPAGWSKRATDHSMWSDLLDEKGRKRGSIFYKAAFYDRNASMYGLATRYAPLRDYPKEPNSPVKYYVGDYDGTILHEVGQRKHDDYATGDKLERQSVAWIAEHYPNWKDPLAYWD